MHRDVGRAGPGPEPWLRGGGALLGLFALALAAVHPAPVSAQSQEVLARQETVRAANEDAIRALTGQVRTLPLAGIWTVGRFVEELEVEADFRKVMQGALQVGAPRWVDDHCQVQLEVHAARIAHALKLFANAKGKRSPLTAAQIDAAVSRWPARSFEATGTSALPQALRVLRPVAAADGGAWGRVGDKAREEALAQANDVARQRVLDRLAPIPLAGGQTLGEAFRVPEVDRRLREYFARRPVTRADFREDLEVEVEFAVDPEQLFDMVRRAVEAQKQIPSPTDEAAWSKVEQELARRLVPAIGRARAQRAGGGGDAEDAPRTLPARPPAWAAQDLEVTGRSPAAGSRLKTISNADADAAAALRRRLADLPLGGGATLGQLSRRSRPAAEAIDRFVATARPLQTTHAPDGSVTVRVRVDLRDLWEELRRSTAE